MSSPTFCDQLQASGAVRLANPARAILDAHTFNAILTNNVSGNAVDYCSLATFTTPVDIRSLVTGPLVAGDLDALAALRAPLVGLVRRALER